MRNIVILIFLNTTIILVQNSFLSVLLPPTYVPNLLLALSFTFTLYDKDTVAYMSALIGGMLFDLLTFNIVGETSLIFVASLFLFSQYRRYFSKTVFSSLLGVLISNSLYLWLIGYFASPKVSMFLINGLLTFGTIYLFRLVIRWFLLSFRNGQYLVKNM